LSWAGESPPGAEAVFLHPAGLDFHLLDMRTVFRMAGSPVRRIVLCVIVLLLVASQLLLVLRRMHTPGKVEAEPQMDLTAEPSPVVDFSGAASWLNSPPLTASQLKGKVVVVDFWTYSCINCLRALPYLESWYERYKDSGLVVIGVSTPEFEFEKNPANIQRALKKFSVTFPVAVDSDHRIWNSFHNQYWPAHYFIDAHGVIRHAHFGEGQYDRSEQWIRQLLEERKGAPPLPAMASGVAAEGIQAAAAWQQIGSPETYIGSERADRFASPGGEHPRRSALYEEPHTTQRNAWGLGGRWTVREQFAQLDAAPGRIFFRFHARDLHLVLGPAADGKPVHFRVLIDGQAPSLSHGMDCNDAGEGVVQDERLYQLVRQPGPIEDHTFEIEFTVPGVRAFSFTFG
jgi:thiol-disulfide isomerase/thioredoxin